MKKFLSLVLALVMTMSLVTISAGAKDFNDDSSIKYNEAVDVMSEVGVIDGYATGAFNPQNTLTRGAAAKIICNMILGPTTAGALSANAAPFKDVPANHTFAAYIAYCSSQGIINGYGDGTFKPAGTVTGFQFLKMLLGALGYDSKIQNFTGSNWTVNVAKLASSLKLTNGNDEFVGSKALTREEACLYGFNTMNATMVEYENKGSSIIIGGVEVSQGASKATDVVNNANSETIKNDNLMQFAERYFTNLRLSSGGTDAFGAPANTWKVKSKDVGTYAKTADLTYTAATKMGTIYSDLGLSKSISAADITVYQNGVTVDTGLSTSATTWNTWNLVKGDVTNEIGGNGSVTKVYYDDEDGTVVIAVTETFVGQVTATYAASSTRDAYVNFDTKTGVGSTFETEDSYSVDDYVVYSYSYMTGEVGVKSMAKAEVVTGTLTAYTVGKSVTVGGTTYKSNVVAGSKAAIDSTLSNAMKTDVSVYLDENGYAAYVDASAAADNYAVVMGYDGLGGVGMGNSRNVKLLFADGTTKTVSGEAVRFGANDTDNTAGTVELYDVVSYRLNSEGTYKLTEIARKNTSLASGTIVVNKGDASLINGSYNLAVPGNLTANGKTVFVFAKTNVNGNTSYNAYKGIANVPKVTLTGASTVTAYAASGTVAKFVFIETTNATVSNASKDVIFIKGNNSGSSNDSDLNDYYEYDAIINGVIGTIKTTNSLTTGTIATNVSKDSKGVYTVDTNSIANIGQANGVSNSATDGLYYGVGTDKAVNGTISLRGTAYSVASDCKVFNISSDGNTISESSVASIGKDTDDLVWYKMTSGEITTIVYRTIDATSGPIVPANIISLTGTNPTAGTINAVVTLDAPTTTTVPVTLYAWNTFTSTWVAQSTANIAVTASTTGNVNFTGLATGNYRLTCGTFNASVVVA